MGQRGKPLAVENSRRLVCVCVCWGVITQLLKIPRKDNTTHSLQKDKEYTRAISMTYHKSGPGVTAVIQVAWNFQTVLFLLSVQVSISFKCCLKIPALCLPATLQGNWHHGRAVFLVVYGREPPGWWAPELNQLLNTLNVFLTLPLPCGCCDHGESKEWRHKRCLEKGELESEAPGRKAGNIAKNTYVVF